MQSLDEARRRVVEAVQPLAPVERALEDTAGLVLAADVEAPHDLPRFDNSAMDGYALRAEDAMGADEQRPVTLTLAGEVRAGRALQTEVQVGTAVRIMTGAPLPPGADAVVPVEQTAEEADRVLVKGPVSQGDHVRRAGEDLRAGDVAVAAGTELGAGEVAVLASIGSTVVKAFPRPRVALLVTGDELVSVDEEPRPGQIRDSNSLALKTLIAEAGGTLAHYARVEDRYESVLDAFKEAATYDLIVSSGGVAVGRYDLVKRAVEEIGRIDFWKVAMKPGKPVVLGEVRDTTFLALPGNPVSVHVSFEQFVRPVIRKMRGCRRLFRPVITATLTEAIAHRPGRLELVRVRLSSGETGWLAKPTGAQGSHIQSSLVDTDGLAHFPADAAKLEAGSPVRVEVWRLPGEA